MWYRFRSNTKNKRVRWKEARLRRERREETARQREEEMLKRASLETLSKKLREVGAERIAREKELEGERNRLKEANRAYEAAQARIDAFRHELLAEVREQKEDSSTLQAQIGELGLFARLFTRRKQRLQKAAEEAQRRANLAYEKFARLPPPHIGKPESREVELQLIIQRLIEREAFLRRFVPAAEERQRKNALAAAHVGSGRKMARAVRAQLSISALCPYCGDKMSEEPHCDHIYPLAHGGLSTAENMVFICASCNKKKRDMTLREFMIKFGLNREAIERGLTELKKKF